MFSASRPAALRADNRALGSGVPTELLQRAAQIAAQRYRAAATLFGGAVVQLDAIADPSVGIEYHRPGQLGDLAGAEAGSDRQ